ncbi:dTDP-4-dehydrorhamnose 3,5-epimerase [Alkalihalobacillus hwajinpoensis]|uniref:dTDP-4-dehydrorhamnose 3,5-epimerase n=1 Tax=Guptibacillus hwajinpoensis TaxID=208199 RepID=UPI00188354F6|nr:dTDP-4-dehydrorhamnose 3,5-epimerase [Pseudalkalibacillus hwajinpoensis]MBF0705407.1 dTDP-4-dehydrorhamnose 3,5-epimerase [Pseudalkalibacillus hwajinpoensis]
MEVIASTLNGVKLLQPKVFGDQRGFFLESFNEKMFNQNGLPVGYLQDNHSLSEEAGILRGLHYQLEPRSQLKVVRVITGVIYDVVVDLRKGSPTYKEWKGFILSEFNHRMLVVPKGFAHGFCTLTTHTNVCYKVDEYYSPEHDRGIMWNDPELNIDWPVSDPILSAKDQQHPLLKDAEINFTMESVQV